MDKEAFTKRMAELAEIKQKAFAYNRKEREKAEQSYIDANCPFKVGDKVTYKGKPGTIHAIRANFDGNFEYDFRPYKKDGTPSVKMTTVYWYHSGLKKA